MEINEYSLAGIAVALIGVLKGKDVWDYLRVRHETKHKGTDKVIEIYEKQILEYKGKISQLEAQIEMLRNKFAAKITKSRGKKS